MATSGPCLCGDPECRRCFPFREAPEPHKILTITIADEDGFVVQQFWTNEDMGDVIGTIQDHISVYDSKRELEEAERDE